MERIFKTLETKVTVDLLPYCKEYIDAREGIEILIGCDSQNRKSKTLYAVVLALYTPGKGAHVLYTRFTTPRERSNDQRLISEVWYSTELAEYLLANNLPRARYIDIDINEDRKYESNKTLSEAAGMVTGLGYNVRHKGNDPVMTYAADRLVKKK